MTIERHMNRQRPSASSFPFLRVSPAVSWTLLVGLLTLLMGERSVAQVADGGGFAITLHGGAGIEPEKLTDEQRRQYRESLKSALEVGRTILTEGGTALTAVERTIRVLEDDPLFNAGRGAVFNDSGEHELDAALMDGKTLRAGAVAGVRTVKNPISLARLVMTETRHILLAGDGAEKFADDMKSHAEIVRVPNSYFSTEARRLEWQQAVEKEKLKSATPRGMGTVGCVARDKQGNLAAGTSTGGLTNKKWGRIGGVPIVGAGTYANNATCAVSGTGIGEEFIRHSIAYQVSALMQFKGLSLDDAVRHVIENVLENDTGGIIAVDSSGRIVMRLNTPGMARAAADSTGRIEIKLER